MEEEMKSYLYHYGYRGLSLMVGELIKRAPEFPGDKELAKEIGTALDKLEVALRAIDK